nr:hypothetical protein K2ALPHA62_LOCUS73 [Klebsiella phage vB_Kpn_K2alpha62]
MIIGRDQVNDAGPANKPVPDVCRADGERLALAAILDRILDIEAMAAQALRPLWVYRVLMPVVVCDLVQQIAGVVGEGNGGARYRSDGRPGT